MYKIIYNQKEYKFNTLLECYNFIHHSIPTGHRIPFLEDAEKQYKELRIKNNWKKYHLTDEEKRINKELNQLKWIIIRKDMKAIRFAEKSKDRNGGRLEFKVLSQVSDTHRIDKIYHTLRGIMFRIVEFKPENSMWGITFNLDMTSKNINPKYVRYVRFGAINTGQLAPRMNELPEYYDITRNYDRTFDRSIFTTKLDSMYHTLLSRTVRNHPGSIHYKGYANVELDTNAWPNKEAFFRWYYKETGGQFIYDLVLEKDTLQWNLPVGKNKRYSPETCILIPARLNTLLADDALAQHFKDFPLPLGVTVPKKYRDDILVYKRTPRAIRVSVKFENGTSSHKHFMPTQIYEAFEFYKMVRELKIILLADFYYRSLKMINERAYNALLAFRVIDSYSVITNEQFEKYLFKKYPNMAYEQIRLHLYDTDPYIKRVVDSTVKQGIKIDTERYKNGFNIAYFDDLED